MLRKLREKKLWLFRIQFIEFDLNATKLIHCDNLKFEFAWVRFIDIQLICKALLLLLYMCFHCSIVIVYCNSKFRFGFISMVQMKFYTFLHVYRVRPDFHVSQWVFLAYTFSMNQLSREKKTHLHTHSIMGVFVVDVYELISSYKASRATTLLSRCNSIHAIHLFVTFT